MAEGFKALLEGSVEAEEGYLVIERASLAVASKATSAMLVFATEHGELVKGGTYRFRSDADLVVRFVVADIEPTLEGDGFMVPVWLTSPWSQGDAE